MFRLSRQYPLRSLGYGASIMTSPWRRCSVRLPSFAGNRITRCTSAAVRIPQLRASIPISPIMLSWCAAAVLTPYTAVSGTTNPSSAATTFTAWKRSWAFAMPSTQCRRSELRFSLEMIMKNGHIWTQYTFSLSYTSAKYKGPKLNMFSNRFTGPGSLKMELHTEATVSFLFYHQPFF